MSYAIERAQLMPSQLAFDLSPGPDEDTSRRVIDFLRSEPSADDVARELVLQFLTPFRARAAVISVIEPDATLHAVGKFGVPEALNSFGAYSVWEDYPSAVALRLRRPIVVTCPEQSAREFPSLRKLDFPEYTLAAVPLLTSVSTVGAVAAYFTSEGSTVLAASQSLQAFADVFVLYLASTVMHRSGVQDAAACCEPAIKVGRPTVTRAATKADFTSRQLAILELLSADMTYDQIASRIGYSHSTVREELMHAYRVLGVRSRRDAIRAAVDRGILTVPVDPSRPVPTAS